MYDRVIFVLGMGRSGTSALTRVLSLCGAVLPPGLLDADDANPRGYWEPREALDLNDRFLAVDGSDWYDVRMPRKVAVQSPRGAEFVDRIKVFLGAIEASGPLILKDPRITALTPFWFTAARQLGLNVSVVIPVRNPMEVAASLATRDDLPMEQSLALWLKYNLLAERASRGLPRVVVAYNNLLADWRREVQRISHGLGVDFSCSREVDAFLDPGLHRERRSGDSAGAPSSVGRIYQELCASGRGESLNTHLFDRQFEIYQTVGLGAERTQQSHADAWLDSFASWPLVRGRGWA